MSEENIVRDYTEGYWSTPGAESVVLRHLVIDASLNTTIIYSIDGDLPEWITNKRTGQLGATIVYEAHYASANFGGERSVQCTRSSDGAKFLLVQEGNASLSKTSESVVAMSGSTSFSVSFADGGSYAISASSDAEWATAETSGNSVIVRYDVNTPGNASRTATISVTCTDANGTVWTIGTFMLTQGVSGSFFFKNDTESATHESGNRFVEWNANGTLGDISATSSASWLRVEASSGGVILSWDANSGTTTRNATVTAVSDTGATATLNFVQSFDSTGGGSTGESTGESGSSGIVSSGSFKKNLTTWQHSADNAYVLCYYNARNDSGIRVAVVDVIDMAEKNLGKNLASVVIDPFSADASELKFYSVNDVVYITHSSMRPKKLMRKLGGSEETGGYTFELAEFDIKIDPVLSEYFDRNVFEVAHGSYEAGDSLTVYEDALTSGQRENGAEEIFSDTSFWRSGQMLMLKKSTQMMKTWGFLYTGGSSNSSAGINTVPAASTIFEDSTGGQGKDTGWMFVFGKVTVETSGKWSGRLVVELWRPDADVDENGEPVSPEELAVAEVLNAMQNRSISRDITEAGSRIRVRCEKRERAKSVFVTTENSSIVYKDADNDTGCFVTISAASELPIYLRIVSVTPAFGGNRASAVCRAIHPFEGGFTSSSFAEGAWCERYGFPKVCGVFQERMAFGGNVNKPCTLWLSKTSDWSNFVQGTDSTSPIFATANTDNIDAIQWIQIAKSYIMFGSLSGEWYFGGIDGSAVKPTNYAFQRLSNFGSSRDVDAVLYGESTIVAKNGGKEVVDVSYNTLSETGSGINLSLFAAHLFENTTITDMAATLSPTGILWALGGNGKVFSFTYEGNNNVFAWARHEFFDGVSAITSYRDGETDKLAMIVNDGDAVMLSVFDPNRGEDYATSRDESIFMDEGADGELHRYESRMIPTPITSAENLEYGHKLAFKALDVYLKTHNEDFEGNAWSEGTCFEISIAGASKPLLCNEQWLTNNVRRGYGENRIVLPATGGWTDVALCDIRTDYPGPLTITAIGAQFAHGN